LVEEKQFIKDVIAVNKKVMGICLGSQLIATPLGSKVYYANEKEIGFFPISFPNEALQYSLFNHFTNSYNVFHWHGDTFDLPSNAILVASTSTSKNQAFLIGNNVLALQFHFEMNETVIEDMLLHDGYELEEQENFIQTKEIIRQHYHHLQQNKKICFCCWISFLGK
jgi:GMP synthase-like glutamine amidotransferase